MNRDVQQLLRQVQDRRRTCWEAIEKMMEEKKAIEKELTHIMNAGWNSMKNGRNNGRDLVDWIVSNMDEGKLKTFIDKEEKRKEGSIL